MTEIRDAPRDIIDLRVELDSLSMLLESAQTFTTDYSLGEKEVRVAQTLCQCTAWCEESMQDLRVVIAPLAEAGSSKRSSMRMFSWIMHKYEVRASIAKLRDREASFSLAAFVMKR